MRTKLLHHIEAPEAAIFYGQNNGTLRSIPFFVLYRAKWNNVGPMNNPRALVVHSEEVYGASARRVLSYLLRYDWNPIGKRATQ